MSRSAGTVPACVATSVMTTGARIQMISCRLASSEKSAVNWRALTIFG